MTLAAGTLEASGTFTVNAGASFTNNGTVNANACDIAGTTDGDAMNCD